MSYNDHIEHQQTVDADLELLKVQPQGVPSSFFLSIDPSNYRSSDVERILFMNLGQYLGEKQQLSVQIAPKEKDKELSNNNTAQETSQHQEEYFLQDQLSHSAETRDSEGGTGQLELQQQQQHQKKKIRKRSIQRTRNKEKTVEYVWNYIQQWRELYEKGVQEQGEIKKLNLTQAAQRLGLPRKTLDDYHGQIKKGQAANFNFEENWKKPIGVLRSFNKANKALIAQRMPLHSANVQQIQQLQSQQQPQQLQQQLDSQEPIIQQQYQQQQQQFPEEEENFQIDLMIDSI